MSKRVVTVKATNGAVFELRAEEMHGTESALGHSEPYCSTRADVRKALRGKRILARIKNAAMHGWNEPPEPYTHVLETGSALALGCMNFNKADAAKIRRWAKGGK